MATSTEKGAQSTIFATSTLVLNGKPFKIITTKYKIIIPAKIAFDKNSADRFWYKSERLLNTKFNS